MSIPVLVFVEIKMKSSLKVISILFIIGLLTACNTTSEQLQCHPIEVNECTGWLGDKPIYIEQ